MGSPGSSPLCEQGQDWAHQASCSQSHNKGRTHPSSLPGQSGEAQASGQGGWPGAQAQGPSGLGVSTQAASSYERLGGIPSVTLSLTVTCKPGFVPGLCAHLGEATWEAGLHRPFWKPAVGPAWAPRAFATFLDYTLHSGDYAKWRWESRCSRVSPTWIHIPPRKSHMGHLNSPL